MITLRRAIRGLVALAVLGTVGALPARLASAQGPEYELPIQEAPKKRKPLRAERYIVPDLATIKAPYVGRDGAITVKTKGITVRVQPLREERRPIYFAHRTKLGFDPFPSRRDGLGVTIFEVSFRNDADVAMTFTPDLVTLWYGKAQEVRRFQEDQLRDLLRTVLGAASADELATYMRVFFLQQLSLDVGEQVTGLIVFEQEPAKAKTMELDLDHVFVGLEEFRPRFPFQMVTPQRRR